MGNGPSKTTGKTGDKENNNGGNNSFIVDPFDEDESTYRNRTTSEGWELSQNEIPVELDIDEHHNQLKQPKGANSPGSSGESDAIKASPETDKTVPVVIRWPWPAKSVHVICSYDNWKRHDLTPESHDERNSKSCDSFYLTILNLPHGKHLYRYIVDDKETINQKEKSVHDDNGRLNNLISVGKADFEAFAALKMDSAGTENDCEYGQVEPKPQNPMEAAKSKNQPPFLPNHLMHKVLLNQDTEQSCDPSLLPVPNSSQLNHLYAQSIRDDTLALSATHRFRGKFVTTLLYKPIEQNVPRRPSQRGHVPPRM